MSSLLLITGGSRGIGAATARLAAAQGWPVVLTYLTARAAAEEVVAGISGNGGSATALPCDVSSEASILELFREVDQIGTLGALVNNAATLETQMRLDAMDSARIHRTFAANAIGPMLCAREAIRRLSTSHGGTGGSIVNVSSLASKFGSPGEYVDYAASKGALDTFTLGLAKEVAAEGVRVNAVRPGHIFTGMHAKGGELDRVRRVTPLIPLGRGGQPEEVARAILWLLSPEASYVTGTLLDVTGGR